MKIFYCKFVFILLIFGLCFYFDVEHEKNYSLL